MLARVALYGALVIALGIVVISACGPQPQAQPSPTATASRPPVITATPTATATPTIRPSQPSAAPTAAPTAATSCPRLTGGSNSNQAQLVAVRIAHNPGFDRLVFEFGTSTAPGPFGMPGYDIQTAQSLSGPSGQPIAITGNALIGVAFQNTSTRTPTGGTSYSGSTDLRPATPLIKNVRIVEDFERVMVWGVGLERLACPTVLTLESPLRVVLDFPTPP